MEERQLVLAEVNAHAQDITFGKYYVTKAFLFSMKDKCILVIFYWHCYICFYYQKIWSSFSGNCANIEVPNTSMKMVPVKVSNIF